MAHRALIPVRFPYFAGLLLLLAPTALNAQEMVFPGERWERWTPPELTERGYVPARAGRLFEFVRDSTEITGLFVADGGREVFSFGDLEDLSYLASVRKSILSILYGPFVDDGTIDLNATLAELGMDDESGLMEIERQATVDHLITARSGVYHPASNGGDNLADAPARGSQEPGTYMLYNNWDFNAAGAVFEQRTGRNIYDEIERQLAGPIGFEDWDRSIQRKSGDLEISRNPAYHMRISTRDIARIGHLMLNRGRWGDRQIVSEEWADRIVSRVTPLEKMHPLRRRSVGSGPGFGYFGYGYMWWIWDGPLANGPFAGAYTARGAWGQWITVLPALDMVIAVKTNSTYRRTTSWASWERMLELLLELRGVELEEYPWSGR